MAADARIMSAVIRSRRLLNVRKAPVSTSTAPSSSTGCAPSASTSMLPKSTLRSSMPRSSALAVPERGVSYGLTAGSSPRPCSVAAHSVTAFAAWSSGPAAALSAQNPASRSRAAAGSPSRSAHQVSRAHTAPPDVPLSPTIRMSCSSSASRSPRRTPAVKAVWLPPPWQAIATRRGLLTP